MSLIQHSLKPIPEQTEADGTESKDECVSGEAGQSPSAASEEEEEEEGKSKGCFTWRILVLIKSQDWTVYLRHVLYSTNLTS